jgi:O-acetyl-ADP-ribose deacetylase (regulator of RNase III)
VKEEEMAGGLVAREELPGGRVFEIVVGNLLEEPVDAIVNAANGRLAHGGGVAAVIAHAAGASLVEEGDAIVRERGPVPVGEAVVTTAGRLPFQGVIHAVGPHMGLGGEEEKLTRTLQSAFLRAHERGWRSVSFPAVSSGIFAVPLEVCARAYVAAVRGFWAARPEASLDRIRLCLLEGPLVDLVREELQRPESDDRP